MGAVSSVACGGGANAERSNGADIVPRAIAGPATKLTKPASLLLAEVGGGCPPSDGGEMLPLSLRPPQPQSAIAKAVQRIDARIGALCA
jgi:hypothetical protein